MIRREPSDQFERPKYGWLKYRPRLLQCCLTSRWILVACCFFVAAESFVVIGLSGVIITSLEKRFYLRSYQVGGIITCYEVSAIVLTLIVSYYGHVHKAKWLGSGAIVLGIGCIIFVMPQWLSGKYVPIVAQTSDLCLQESSGNHTTPSEQICRNSEWYYIFIFVLGQLLIGAGASPIYNLCAAYIDENVSRKNSGVYLAVFYAVSGLGPALGFVLGGYFLTIYVDIDQPEGVNLTPNDNSWVGAWWLGYLLGGIISLIAAIPLFGFPTHLPNIRALQAEKRLAEDSVPDDDKPRTLKEFLPALKSIFKNKVFLFTTIAVTAEGFHLTGATFFPKFIESQYDLSSSDASLYVGGVVVPGAAIGVLFGGYLIRRFEWTCKQCIKAATVGSFISTMALFVFLIHCPNKHIAEAMSSYLNSSQEGSMNVCYTMNNCSCNQHYIPVCTREDQLTHFSPCHAGCSGQTIVGEEKMYTNCSCLPGNLTVAYDGGCNKSCDSLVYFLVIVLIMVIVTFTSTIPSITVTLRCLPESQGSFALGVQQFIAKLFAFIPGPIVFGALLDSVCILSETDPCDENSDRNCLEYRNDHLGYVFLGGMATCKTISVISFALAWFFYKPPKHDSKHNAELASVKEDLAITS